MLFAIAFVSTFVLGGLTGLYLGNVSVDIPLSNTYFVVAHFHMVMAVSPILVVFGGLYHWYPKVTGRLLDDTLGRAHFWITFVGTYAIYFPMTISASWGCRGGITRIRATASFRIRRRRSTRSSRSSR